MLLNIGYREYEVVDQRMIDAQMLESALMQSGSRGIYIQTYKDEIDPYDRILVISKYGEILYINEINDIMEFLEPFPGNLIDAFFERDRIISDANEIEIMDETEFQKMAENDDAWYLQKDDVLIISFHMRPIAKVEEEPEIVEEKEIEILISTADSPQSHFEAKTDIGDNTPIEIIEHDIRRPVIEVDDDEDVKADINSTSTVKEPIIKDVLTMPSKLATKPEDFTKSDAPIKPEKKNGEGSRPSGARISIDPITRQKNLRKYCGIDYNSIIIILMAQKEVVIINRHTGEIKKVQMQHIMANELIGIEHEFEIVKILGDGQLIHKPVKDVRIADYRHVIKSYEDRKETVPNGWTYTIDNDILYVSMTTFRAAENNLSIREATICMYRETIEKHDALKSHVGAYSADLYALITPAGVSILLNNGVNGASVISIEDLYEFNQDSVSIWDILSMFPDTKIINGTQIGISNVKDVDGFAKLPKEIIMNCSNPFSVKDVWYAFDPIGKKVLGSNC